MKALLWALAVPAAALAVPYQEQIRLAPNAMSTESYGGLYQYPLLAQNTVSTVTVPLASTVTTPLAGTPTASSSTSTTADADDEDFEVKVRFNRPTLRENGTVLEANEIAGYRLVCSDLPNLQRIVRHSAYLSSRSFLLDTPEAPYTLNEKEITEGGAESMTIKYVNSFIPASAATPIPKDKLPEGMTSTEASPALEYIQEVDAVRLELEDRERVYCAIGTRDTDGLLSELSDPSTKYAEYRKPDLSSPPVAPVLTSKEPVGLLGLVVNTVPTKQIGKQNITLTWGLPSKKVNGDPLAATDIKEYRVYCASSQEKDLIKANLVGTVASATKLTVEKYLPTDGTRHWCGISAVDKNDLESELAMSAAFWIGGCLPADNIAPGMPSDVLIRLIP